MLNKMPKLKDYWKKLTPKEKKEQAMKLYLYKLQLRDKQLILTQVFSFVLLTLMMLLLPTKQSMIWLFVGLIIWTVTGWYILLSKKVKV